MDRTPSRRVEKSKWIYPGFLIAVEAALESFENELVSRWPSNVFYRMNTFLCHRAQIKGHHFLCYGMTYDGDGETDN